MTTGFKPRSKQKQKRSPSPPPALTPEQQKERDRSYVPTPCIRTDRWLNTPRHMWIHTAWLDADGEEQTSQRRVFGPVLSEANKARAIAQHWTDGEFLHLLIVDGGCPERYVRCPPDEAIWVGFWSPENTPPYDIASANGKTQCVMHVTPVYVRKAVDTISQTIWAIAFWQGYHSR